MQVSTASKIVPSPDWFVGVDSVDLCEHDEWLHSKSIDLHPIDAGTDKGFTFTSPNWAEYPFRPIFQITPKFPSHPANSFYYPDMDVLPAIAKITFTRLHVYINVDEADN